MKCEACLSLLEEYVDSELAGREAEQVGTHLMGCANCAVERELLSTEQEIYSRYDRTLAVSPAMWSAIAERAAPAIEVVGTIPRAGFGARFANLFRMPALGLSFAGALVVLLLATAIGVAYLKMRKAEAPKDVIAGKGDQQIAPATGGKELPPKPVPALPASSPVKTESHKNSLAKTRIPKADKAVSGNHDDDVLFSDVAYSVVEEKETQRHLEQAQNLLRSVRNIELNDDDAEIDVSYEKSLSRQLLDENVVLRRDAEMSGKFPVKILLSSLEPFLLDIANLPDKTSVADLREIKDRVQKTEIVAALHTY